MKIRVIAPATGEVLMPLIESDVDRWVSPGTEIDVVQIPYGPESIESEYDEALSVPPILDLVRKAEDDGIDGIFVTCFAEPGVHAAREIFSGPVVGGFSPAVHAALGVADKVGIISVLPDVVPMLDRLINSYTLQGRVAGVRYVNMPVLDVHDHAVLLEKLEAEAREAIAVDGVSGFVLGCTGMIGVAEELSRRLSADFGHVPVVDPTGAAITSLEQSVKLGISSSRLAYYPPRAKARTAAVVGVSA